MEKKSLFEECVIYPLIYKKDEEFSQTVVMNQWITVQHHEYGDRTICNVRLAVDVQIPDHSFVENIHVIKLNAYGYVRENGKQVLRPTGESIYRIDAVNV